MKKVIAVLVVLVVCVWVAFAGETARDGRFIAYDNGTVLDTKTNLMWAAQDNGTTVSWADAKFYCENYRGGGYTNWRMPTQDELAGVYDEAKTPKAVNGKTVHLTELIHLATSAVWASETNVLPHANVISNNDTSAIFIFSNGKRIWIRSRSLSDTCALPVRSTK